MSERGTDSGAEFEVSGFSIVLFSTDIGPSALSAVRGAFQELFEYELESIDTDPLPLGDREAVLDALESAEPVLAAGRAAVYEDDGVIKIVTPELGIVVIEQVAVPYFSNPRSITASIEDARLAKSIEEHVGFIELGLLGLEVVEHPIDASRRICRLAARLCSEDVSAVAIPDRNLLASNRVEILDALRSREPFEWPVRDRDAARRLNFDDPEFDRATAQARSNWPEFERAFTEGRDGDMFSVKIGVYEGEVCENLWFWVRAIDDDAIECELESEPIYLREILRGDKQRFPVRSVLDWVHTRSDGETFGGFTLTVR